MELQLRRQQERGIAAAHLQGVLYVTTNSATMALDVKTGQQLWKTKVEYPDEVPRIVCCGIINRGLALYDGKIFRTTLDANVIALDQKTGKELWRSHVIDFKDGYSETVAPLVADGVVITGISGAEYGIRGFIDGWDPEHRQASVADLHRRRSRRSRTAKSWPGDTWQHGGGSTWITGSFDPESAHRLLGHRQRRIRGIPPYIQATISTPARFWRSIRKPAR